MMDLWTPENPKFINIKEKALQWNPQSERENLN